MWKRLSALWVLVRGDAKLLWHALQHPQAPSWLKAGTAAVLLYLLSPIDFIPDLIPVFGVMDDLVLVPAAIRFMIKHLPAGIRQWAEERAGVGPRTAPSAMVVDELR